MMRVEKVLFILCLLAIMPFILIGSGYAAVSLTTDDALVQKAAAAGRVRVIVTFSVPELTHLQAASRSFRSAVRDNATSDRVISDVREADVLLSNAIHQAGSDLFGNLGLQGKVKHVFDIAPQAVLEVTREELLALANDKGVSKITEDRVVFVPRPDETNQEDGDDTGRSYGVEKVRAPLAWDEGYDGTGWYVAVLDTGVRTSHEMFTGKNIEEACFSSTDTNYNCTSLCPNDEEEMIGAGAAVPPTNESHGTHVAGIAVGDQPNGERSGVAPGADLIAVQVFSYFPAEAFVGSFASDQIRGMEYVYGLRATHNIASVNLSLGGYDKFSSYCDDDSRKSIIDQLTAAGIAVTIANGNEGYCDGLSAPACVSSAISVGASDATDSSYQKNNWSPTMQDIFAPGVAIYSSIATGDTDYGTKTGTSMATPHVAGAWAIFRQTAPTATVSELESLMEDNGFTMASGCTTSPSSGPRLDVAAVVYHYLNQDTPPSADAGDDQLVNEGVTVTLDGSDSIGYSGNDLTFAWSQTSGTTVTLSDDTSDKPTFTAPADVSGSENLVFELTVTDSYNNLTDTDSVTVTVTEQNLLVAPTALAGQDLIVNSGSTVQLDGADSVSNVPGGTLTYLWLQTAGVMVTLSDATVVEPTFVAPRVSGSAELEFRLMVIDAFNHMASTDTVQVTVNHVDSSLAQEYLPAKAFSGEIVGFKVVGDGAFVNLTPLDPGQVGSLPDGVQAMKYLFEIGVKCSAGATVQLVWQFPVTPFGASWYRYDATSGWSNPASKWDYENSRVTVNLTDGDSDGVTSLVAGVSYKKIEGTNRDLDVGCFIDTLLGDEKKTRK